MHNFMTYADAELYPGPRLNVVLGPNGTGKSSIVCAIGLGLGGKPKVCAFLARATWAPPLTGSRQILGRGTNVAAFVKAGTQNGWVEVELVKGSKNVVIRREITQLNTSQFYIDRKKASHDEVLKVVAALGVQVDNLCQFLPQDRVKEFAKMTPVELLKETERAVGSEGMLRFHEELEELQKTRLALTRERDTLADRLKTLTEQNKDMEADVQRYQQREALLEREKLLHQKMVWARVAVKARDKDAAKNAIQAQVERVMHLRETLNPRANELTALRESLSACKADVRRLKDLLNKEDAKRVKLHTELRELMSEHDARADEVAGADEDRRRNQVKIAKYFPV